MVMNKWIKRIIKTNVFLFFLVIGTWSGFPSPANSTDQTMSLKVALLPIIDVFPFYVAEAEGYFSRAGISVKAVPVVSGLERDQLMQVGQVDGMLNEMMSTAVFNRTKVQVKIISTARKANIKSPLFRILGSPKSNINSPLDLSGVPIGVSINTIIEYVTDRLLEEKGLDPEKIILKSVPSIPERYQLLMHGQLKAATLPDPLAKSALEAGAVLVIDDTAYPRYSVSVLSFSNTSLEKKPNAVRLFLKAWNQAVEKINADPERFRPLLLKKIRVPGNVKNSYLIPEFPVRNVPDKEQWSDVMKWMVEKGLIKSPLPYVESVTEAFL